MKAATLAVGTEVTDGQIIDRNSAWISHQLVKSGVEILEHRAVPDETEGIANALTDLAARVDLLFVTGGLGPTSDDFTRDLLAQVFAQPLEYDEASWLRIEERFRARGLPAKPIQKQQCYFPRGSRIIVNNAGTANAFAMSVSLGSHTTTIYVLPGPPLEIESVWTSQIGSEIESLVPATEREDLKIFRTLGRGESEVAERIEVAIAGSGLRVGYRAHLPYVEVKLWVPRNPTSPQTEALSRAQASINEWIVTKDEEDFVDPIIDRVLAGLQISCFDGATAGKLQERILDRIRERKLEQAIQHSSGRLAVTTTWGDSSDGRPPTQPTSTAQTEATVVISELVGQGSWVIELKSAQQAITKLEVQPTSLYNFGTDRGRKYLTEKVLQALATHRF